MFQDIIGGGRRYPHPNIYISIQQVHKVCGSSGNRATSLQCSFNETESMVIEVVIYLLDFVTANDLVLYRTSMDNEAMNNANFKLKLVRSIVNKRIEAVPCSPMELIHQLVISFMNNILRHLCDY